ncbi:MAG TPA: M56 family metallopeptidase [Williamwhitmania sp.]|nr:M56 family metallopeptidase [Williamwhitmania sp.]
MNGYFIYLIKSSLFMAAFWMVYALWLRNQTHFTISRIYLLLSFGLSIVLPFVHILLPVDSSVNRGMSYITQAIPMVTVYGSGSETHVGVVTILSYGYWLISLFLLALLIFQIAKVVVRLRREERLSTTIPDLIVVKGSHFDTPFSFFHFVHVPDNRYDENHLNTVLHHETVHVQKHHSADVLLASIICSVWWVNPFSWLLLKSLREVHEFEADSISKEHGAGSADYIRLMLETSMPGFAPALSTSFNKPLTLKRLAMITKERSTQISALKYLLVIPAMLLLVFIFSTSSCSNNTAKEQPEGMIAPPPPPPPPPAPDSATVTTDSKVANAQNSSNNKEQVFFTVEKMPSFPYKGLAKTEGFQKYIADNLKYPKEALDKQIQGKVYISFVVEADGSMSDIKIVRGVDKYLDAAALQVVTGAPKWVPGEQRGKKVRVSFTFPINFALK